MWKETAKNVFGHIKEDQRRGIYDKVVIDCAFRENLNLKKRPDPDGGCDGFSPSLTTNGMCYTFNGKKASELWRHSEMINTFSNHFPSHSDSKKTYGGSRAVQGNTNPIINFQWITPKFSPGIPVLISRHL